VKRVLITGGAGFIGSHLARSLAAAGSEVHLLDNLSRGQRDRELEALLDRPGVELVELDLLEESSPGALVDDYDVMFHLAAIVGVANVLDAPYRVLRENVAVLDRTLELARAQHGLRRFVFASTSEVYAGTLELSTLPLPTPEGAVLTVPDLARPRTSYMLSKLYGEALCIQSGLPVTMIRPHNVYGPRMGLSHVIPELLQRAHDSDDGGRLGVYSVDHRRTFCHVSDAVRMIVAAAESPDCAGEVLNVGRQEPEVRISELAELVIQVVGRRLEVEPLPTTPGSPPRRCPDMSKTRRLTGCEPHVGLEEGVRDTYDWYREHVFAPAAPSAPRSRSSPSSTSS
jgi:UDP-glucose 4-epimerase